MQELLKEALGETRSVGWLSELLKEAGERAGKVLMEIDTSAMKDVIIVRDETYFDEYPLLLVIDPVSGTILKAIAAPDRTAETWALVLWMAEEQGATLGGVVEDMATMYPASLVEAELDLDVQKDVWHIERDGSKILQRLEKSALKQTGKVIKVEKKLLKKWEDDVFIKEYIPLVEKEEQLYEQHQEFSTWLSHLCDALELVDLRSGEIRDKETNAWLLEETLHAFEQIDFPRIQTWTQTLRRHQDRLLTFLDWLASALTPYHDELAQILPSPSASTQFISLVARSWRLRQAVLSNHDSLRAASLHASQELDALIDDLPLFSSFRDRLFDILDAACRASSLVENINGLLKSFLRQRRSFPDSLTLQRYLDLFTLWHNLRVFQRGKRQGHSPYQLAGVHTPSEDWLTLLGYPPP